MARKRSVPEGDQPTVPMIRGERVIYVISSTGQELRATFVRSSGVDRITIRLDVSGRCRVVKRDKLKKVQ